jgi:phospholipid N-methyltransferase
MLRIISESFDEPDIPDTWTTTVGYVSAKDGTVYRAFVLSPPAEKRPLREPYEYVAHIMTLVREKGPVMHITFGHGTSEEQDEE